MTNIFQQFAAWVTNLRQSEFERAAAKLTLNYVASTLVILIVSSAAMLVLYTPPKTEIWVDDGHRIEQVNNDVSAYEFREHLLSVIVVVDLFLLVFVSVFSYFAARRTLRPIKLNQERQLELMGTVAHELRTPLTVMRAGGDTILRQDRSIQEYKEFVRDVNEETERLTRLSNQLLQLLRGRQSIDEFSLFDFSVLVKKELIKIEAYAKLKDIRLFSDIQEIITLKADKDGLVQVLQNLVKNAIDYNRSGGKVTVSLANFDSKTVQLIVADTGIGIESDKHQVIFDRFETLDKARTQGADNGAGLGLSIVKEIVKVHGGTISVESVVGEGTTITVLLPQKHS